MLSRACLKNAFRKMYVTICGRFCPDEGVVAGYGNRIRAKYIAKWGVQIAEMIFQTRSKPLSYFRGSSIRTSCLLIFFVVLRINGFLRTTSPVMRR